MPSLTIRQYGDPVLKERTREVEEIDGKVASLVESMIETMYEAPGTGLAANQVGVQRRIFVYDVGEGARAVINPRIVESDGEWTYDEGCLSIPGLSWEIVRPNAVHLVGLDLAGEEISLEVSELEGRVFQHELDHLDGVLLVERLDEDQRKEALKILRAAHAPRAAWRPRWSGQPPEPLADRRSLIPYAARAAPCPTVGAWLGSPFSAPRQWRLDRCASWPPPDMTSRSASPARIGAGAAAEASARVR